MDIVVVGSCNVDLISYVEKLPSPGETIKSFKFNQGLGGKGANQCVSAARLGAKTAMISKVGVDSFGDLFIKNFKEAGINTDFLAQTSKSSTGVAAITVDKNGENAIVITPGANELITEGDVAAANQIIIGSKILLCQFEINQKVVKKALELASAHGVTTILNCAPVVPNIDFNLLRLADYVCLNEIEASALVNFTIENTEDAEKACFTLREKGCKCVIITLGSNGVVYYDNSSQPLRVPAQKANVIDTTGAGDSFCGSLAYFMSCMSKLPFNEQITRACHVASISVEKEGTQSSYPMRSQLPEDLFKF